jgi:signal transduction histidine kinase
MIFFRRFGFKTFRQRFFASYVLLLLVFLALLFPFVSQSVQHIVYRSMNMRIDALIDKIKDAKDDLALIELLKNERRFVFYRIGLLDDRMCLLYDSHTRRLRGAFFFPLLFSSHAEMLEAEKTGTGYAEEYSQVLKQKMIYLARRFEFHNKPYYLRLAFPYEYIQDLRNEFKWGFILFSSVALILFGTMSALVVHRMTRPIHEIIEAIKPYQKEKPEHIPRIHFTSIPPGEFQQLADTIHSLSDRIERQMEALKEFIANASHELKTPITIIQGFAETLIDYPLLPRETTCSITNKIALNCERMNKTVQNLLALATIEQLPLSRITSCNLVEIATGCIKRIKELFPSVAVSLDYAHDEPYELFADSELLEVALTNLIDNAAKYAKEEPAISIRLKRESNHICIEVEDNGIGIAPSDVSNIFQRFYRAKVLHAKKPKGSGLGLAITETIAHKHFGTVSVTSTYGKGSLFTLHIASDIDKRIEKMI